MRVWVYVRTCVSSSCPVCFSCVPDRECRCIHAKKPKCCVCVCVCVSVRVRTDGQTVSVPSSGACKPAPCPSTPGKYHQHAHFCNTYKLYCNIHYILNHCLSVLHYILNHLIASLHTSLHWLLLGASAADGLQSTRDERCAVWDGAGFTS